MASWGELQQVESVDVADVDSGDVPDGLEELDVLLRIDDEGAAFEGEFGASACLVVSGLQGALEVLEGADALEEGHDLLGLFVVVDLVVDDQWEFRDLLDFVAAGVNQRHKGGGGDGGGKGVAFLLDIHATVPSSVCAQRGEHASFTALVAESTLATAVGS